MTKLSEQEKAVVQSRIDGLKQEVFAAKFDLDLIEGDEGIDDGNRSVQAESAKTRIKSAESRLKIAQGKLNAS